MTDLQNRFFPRLRTDAPGIAEAINAQAALLDFAARFETAVARPFAELDVREVDAKRVATARRDIARRFQAELKGKVFEAVNRADYKAKEALRNQLATLRLALSKVTAVELTRAQLIVERTFAPVDVTGDSAKTYASRVRLFRENVAALNPDYLVAGLLLSDPAQAELRAAAEAALVDASGEVEFGLGFAFRATGSYRVLRNAGMIPANAVPDSPSRALRRLQVAAEIVAGHFAEAASFVESIARSGEVREETAFQKIMRGNDEARMALRTEGEALLITIPNTVSTGRGSVSNADGTRTTTPNLADASAATLVGIGNQDAAQRILDARTRGGAA